MEHVKLATAHKVRCGLSASALSCQDILTRLGDSLTKGTATLFELAQAATDLRALEAVVAERMESHAGKTKAFEKGTSNVRRRPR